MYQEPVTLSQNEKLARLRLIRTANIGPITYRQLLGRYGSAENALNALPELSKNGGRKKPLTAYSKAKAEKEIKALKDIGGHLIVCGDHAYPLPLSHIEDAPPILMALGDITLLKKKTFAIVGARNASIIGQKIAGNAATKLGKAGYVIASGLARGIDGTVHSASITTGTIAVVAGGIDVVYPREHQTLYEQIVEYGLVISEMPLGTQPIARHFPPRNRIISGLSIGVLIVEATERSGSLITARMANEQGREIFAVPGSPLDPRAKGPNSLIRDGAVLVQSTGDILEVLHSLGNKSISEPEYDLFDSPVIEPLAESDLERARLDIKEKLSFTAVSIDEIIRLTGFSPAVVQTVLLELELAGEISRYNANRVAFC